LDGINSAEEQTTSLAFLCDLWLLVPQWFHERDDKSEKIVTFLKKLAIDEFRPLRICANAEMFRLLQIFSKEKNKYAITIFTNIAYSLTENYEDSSTRSYILSNLILLFQENKNYPIGFILDPYLKSLQTFDVSGVNLIDLDFLKCMAKHKKLSKKYALPLLDILIKIYLNNI
jgi:hypothetical protein